MKIFKTRAGLRNADVIVFSLGKSGRTWLRVMLNKYLSLHFDVPFTTEDLHRQNSSIPSITYSHHLWLNSHEYPRWLNQLLARFPLMSRAELHQKKVILLTRDPRDTIVSNFFQLTKRARDDKRIDDISISEFLRHPYWGIESRVELMNRFYQTLKGHPHLLVVTYESLKADAPRELQRILRFLEIEPKPNPVSAAIEFADFGNMRKMEESSEVSKQMLRPGDPNDPESFKVRKGKVGGYVEYLDTNDIGYVEQHVGTLLPEYGYHKPPVVKHP